MKNIGSNGLGLFVTIFNQVLLLPVFLHYWSVDLYGDWITLSAVSVFFTSSDLGFTTYFTNSFVVHSAQGEDIKCRKILTNNYFFLLSLFLPILFILLVLLKSIDIVPILGLHYLNSPQSNTILVLLVLHVLLTMLGKIPNAIYRSSHLAHRAFFIDNMVWLSESVLTALLVIFKLSAIIVAVGILIPRIFIFIYKIIDTKRLFSYSFQYRDVSIKEIKEAVGPSVSIASFPFSNTILMQGLSLLVNKFYGASDLVLFNTSRTVGNMIKFCSNTITQSFYPEFSIAYGKRDAIKIRLLERYCVFSAIAFSLFSIILILPFGDIIFRVWTRGKVPFEIILMSSFLFVIIIDNLWNAILAPLISTNKHRSLGFIAVAFSIIVVLAVLLVSSFGGGLQVIVLCQLLLHVPMLVIIERQRRLFVKQLLYE